MLSFTQTLLDQRRQKSLQLSIQLRKKRLEDLRSSRLLALREERQKAIEEAKDNQKRYFSCQIYLDAFGTGIIED